MNCGDEDIRLGSIIAAAAATDPAIRQAFIDLMNSTFECIVKEALPGYAVVKELKANN